MSARQVYLLPFVMSLVGGIIVLAVSILNLAWFGSGTPTWGGVGDYRRGVMGQQPQLHGQLRQLDWLFHCGFCS